MVKCQQAPPPPPPRPWPGKKTPPHLKPTRPWVVLVKPVLGSKGAGTESIEAAYTDDSGDHTIVVDLASAVDRVEVTDILGSAANVYEVDLAPAIPQIALLPSAPSR